MQRIRARSTTWAGAEGGWGQGRGHRLLRVLGARRWATATARRCPRRRAQRWSEQRLDLGDATRAHKGLSLMVWERIARPARPTRWLAAPAQAPRARPKDAAARSPGVARLHRKREAINTARCSTAKRRREALQLSGHQPREAWSSSCERATHQPRRAAATLAALAAALPAAGRTRRCDFYTKNDPKLMARRYSATARSTSGRWRPMGHLEGRRRGPRIRQHHLDRDAAPDRRRASRQVPTEAATKKKLRAELTELARSTKINPKTRRLDPWLST